ncbi:hypothetical protein PMAG_a2001 [Pseudoalteromonas mariniglutinosa NCIMB 1770]|nr:hypothetical protein [Pseudoalteromonas mariniglutinosa NCIMB 1770]
MPDKELIDVPNCQFAATETGKVITLTLFNNNLINDTTACA